MSHSQKKANHLNVGDNPNLTELDPHRFDSWGDYELTEMSNSTLRSLIGYCSREELIEEEKTTPDTNRIQRLEALVKEI